MIDTSIFKAYDIRGTYPEQINEETAYKIGRAFVEYINVKEVAIGRDMRVSSPALFAELVKGINDSGAKVIDLGMIGTEVMYFAVGNYGYESGIMLTASHNPPQYNGMKMVRKGAVPIGADTGIYDLRDMVAGNEYERINAPSQIESKDAYPDFRKKINSLVDLSNLPELKVVVDAANGMGGQLFNSVFSDTNLEVIPMYFEPDGTFPNHEADPLKEENVADLKARVIQERADLGIALDGDGDRCFFIDNNGNYSSGYYLVAILAKKILEKYPNANIVYENRLKWAIQDTLKTSAGNGIAAKAGHSYLKAKMREVDAVFSGETSSHFYYKDMFYADSSMLTIALILELIADTNKSLAELLEEYRNKYFISGEINYEVEDADETLAKVKSKYANEELDELDGVAIDHGREWRFSLRKSNTEPVVRLNVEANSQELVRQKVQEVERLIKG